MTEDLKNSLKIILNAYKEDKFTEEEVFTLLDSMINTNNNSTTITYPYTVYPSYPTYPTHPWDVYCTTTTNDCEKESATHE